jgi:hypothetical protein
MGRRVSDVEKLPLHVGAFKDRHGKRRYYFWRWRTEKKIYLKTHPGTPKHPSAEYKALLAGYAPTNDKSSAKPRTVRDLIDRYYHATDYTATGPVTQEKVRARLEDFASARATRRIADVRFNHIEAILAKKAVPGVNDAGRKVGGPNAAKSLEKDLVRLFDLAIKLEWITVNPVRLAKGVKVPKTTGFHSWTEDEIERYRAYYPLGTMGRLAIEIILWTLLRRGDASRFGPQHRKDGMIHVWNEKTEKYSWLPEPPQLTAAIEAMDRVGLNVYLLNENGAPFASPAVFGNWFAERCRKAGVPGRAHGLRKATARRLAELGNSQQRLKAAGNWSQDKDVATYVQAADQRRLAVAGMSDLAAREGELKG